MLMNIFLTARKEISACLLAQRSISVNHLLWDSGDLIGNSE